MTTMEAPVEENMSRDLECLARITVEAATLRPLYRRALERSQAKLQSGQSLTEREREILHRIVTL